MEHNSFALIPRTTESWRQITGSFKWQIPELFNISEYVCDRHAQDETKVALYYEDLFGRTTQLTFADIRRQANQLANAMSELGIKPGDRFGIILPQRPETAIAHIAAYKLGAIAVPLSRLFGPEALQFRLCDSGVSVLITDADNIQKIRDLQPSLPSLRAILLVDGQPDDDELDFGLSIRDLPTEWATRETKADDPAVIIYTSGTTGRPKGVLHAHRYLIGHLPGFELSHDFFPMQDDLAWTPADWAWIGGLMDVLMPTWFYGKPVLAYQQHKFQPEQCLAIMEKYSVKNVFMPPTALRMLRQVSDLTQRYQLQLRTMMSGGEALGADMLRWASEELSVQINEIYGQTEANYVVGNCQAVFPAVPGSMGRAYPGHSVEVIDVQGNVLPPNQLGEIAFKAEADAVVFLGYWNNPTATQEKFKNGWICSGDLAIKDSSGSFWFKGRKDDVIISAGYRIGPVEIEDVLGRHPSVAMCAVVGAPDQIRGEVVKAYIVLSKNYNQSTNLVAELQNFVRVQLSAYQYPRLIEFVDSLPTTTTGKVKRRVLRERSSSCRKGSE